MGRFFISLLALLGVGTTYASDILPNAALNQKTIQAQIEAGSNPLKPHPFSRSLLLR